MCQHPECVCVDALKGRVVNSWLVQLLVMTPAGAEYR